MQYLLSEEDMGKLKSKYHDDGLYYAENIISSILDGNIIIDFRSHAEKDAGVKFEGHAARNPFSVWAKLIDRLESK